MADTVTPLPAAAESSADGVAVDRDAGYSMLEILISLVLMGTFMGAIITAMFAAISASTVSDDLAELDAVLGGVGDSLGDTLFIACPEDVTPNAYLQYAQAGADAVGWPPGTVQIVDVKYWDPLAGSGGAWADTNGVGGSACDNSAWLSTSKTMQKLVIEVTTPDGDDVRQLEVVMTDTRPQD